LENRIDLTSNHVINTRDLSKGVYFIHVSNQKSTTVTKWVKTRNRNKSYYRCKKFIHYKLTAYFGEVITFNSGQIGTMLPAKINVAIMTVSSLTEVSILELVMRLFAIA
jgi:hypothetical protein